MSNFRENYFKARDIVANELMEKYKLKESYRDNNRLTLDSNTHSIHLTFYVPDGDEVYISEKGKDPGAGGKAFMQYLFDKYPKLEAFDKALEKIFTKLPKKSDPYSADNLYIHFNDKIRFLETNHSCVFCDVS